MGHKVQKEKLTLPYFFQNEEFLFPSPLLLMCIMRFPVFEEEPNNTNLECIVYSSFPFSLENF